MCRSECLRSNVDWRMPSWPAVRRGGGPRTCTACNVVTALCLALGACLLSVPWTTVDAPWPGQEGAARKAPAGQASESVPLVQPPVRRAPTGWRRSSRCTENRVGTQRAPDEASSRQQRGRGGGTGVGDARELFSLNHGAGQSETRAVRWIGFADVGGGPGRERRLAKKGRTDVVCCRGGLDGKFRESGWEGERGGELARRLFESPARSRLLDGRGIGAGDMVRCCARIKQPDGDVVVMIAGLC
jgi:hypothetical protein